jgi:predicted nucleic acid-binding protein
MTRLLIDSCVYISAFLEEDPNHQKPADILNNRQYSIIIPYVVFSEVLTALTYKHSKKLAEEFSNYIFSDERFRIIDNAVFEELLFGKKYQPKFHLQI